MHILLKSNQQICVACVVAAWDKKRRCHAHISPRYIAEITFLKKNIVYKKYTSWTHPEESVGLVWSLVWTDLEKILLNLKKVKKRKSIYLNLGGQSHNNHRGSFPIKQKLLSCEEECYLCYSNGMLGILVKLMPWEFPFLLMAALYPFTCKNTWWTRTRISHQQ